MNEEALDFWQRASQALKTVDTLVSTDPDAAASRAYYAAFYAVSALFSVQGKSFVKHSAVEAAVHRDLVMKGLWSENLGADFSFLRSLRETGDYGGGIHVSSEAAADAKDAACRLLEAVRKASPVFL
ncbi:MAG: HEPN domain-containing protein [Deltaproteobacteria bacterium]|nr:HEPN domain-containing protein [Deltaproteobacteria bacterium]